MKIAVALSGGVDSAVSLYLLKKAGHDVFALFMKNWEEKTPNGQCLSEQDAEDARLTCLHLDVPFYTVNFCDEYWNRVFLHFLNDIKAGYTPNPDILCNKEIKFDLLLKKAQGLGAEALATGHYCQTEHDQLLKGADPLKDQSYFLYAIDPSVLKHVMFPIGHLHKSKVRKIAYDIKLPVCKKRDSTGICFIGKRKFSNFISQYLSPKPGEIHDIDGNCIGKHQGVHLYTIGQRQGLGIGGEGDAWFVVNKSITSNILTVAQGTNHPSLYAQQLIATDPSWMVSQSLTFPIECKAKIRYRQVEQPCTIQYNTNEQSLTVTFKTPQRAITPRQSVVFYQGDICLGGAIIKNTLS